MRLATAGLFFAAFLAAHSTAQDDEPAPVKHVVVAAAEGRFMGWPANNGLWKWDGGREILVGYTDGPFVRQAGHQIGAEHLSQLARSLDGGLTWATEIPENFVGRAGEPVPSPGNIPFGHPDFALRVAADGYHGASDPVGAFFYSLDRGRTWLGPYRFNGLNEAEELEGLQLTARTNYLVSDDGSIQVFMAARNLSLENGSRRDKPFLAESHDAGATFQFVSWIVPWTDPDRAVMPSAARLEDGTLVVAARRRDPTPLDENWVDTFVSRDNGRTWFFLSKVGVTGAHNGNPPALLRLADGRLACCFANRSTQKVLLCISDDGGATWGKARVLRHNTFAGESLPPFVRDLGYPQLVQNDRGELVALYYLAMESPAHPGIEPEQSYIEATIIAP
jgi:hypothetical protein